MSSLSVPRVAPSSRSWSSAGRSSRDEGGDRAGSRSPLPSSPRMPSSKNTRPQGYSRPSRDKPDTIRTNSSSTTSSTSGSSFLDRMRAPSSRTSLEDNQAEPPRRGGGGWASARGKEAANAEEEPYSGEEDASQDPMRLAAGHGYDLWNRVTAVASNLTVNVSQAWQKSVLADGEETPPGQESRLTKAMKAYHLDRARSPADLPAWLFEEHERGVAPKSWSASNPRDYEDRFLPEQDSAPRQQGGLRDVYDRAAASSSSTSAARKPPAESGDGGRSRAENRLRAIRDAKRSAKTGTDSSPSYSEDHGRDVSAHAIGSPETSPGTRTRIGLPPRPGRVR